jgi:hypothetical protein
MWTRGCEREADVQEAARRAALGITIDVDLLDHAACCVACQETLAVASFMQSLASTPAAEGALPDARYLWWKGELLRRWDAQQRASEPIEVGERVQVGVAMVAATGLLAWLWHDVPDLLASATSLATATPLTIIMVCSSAVLAAAAIAMARQIART